MAPFRMSLEQNRIYQEIQRHEDKMANRPKDSGFATDEIEHARRLVEQAIGAGIPDQFFVLLQIYIRRFDRFQRRLRTEGPAGR